jgi:hypothetical protein
MTLEFELDPWTWAAIWAALRAAYIIYWTWAS